MPSMFGMLTSVTTALKRWPLARPSATAPSSASSTAKPAEVRAKETIWRIDAESSTTKIRALMQRSPQISGCHGLRPGPGPG
ncbi:hypothetical protein G6F64_015078 [Rhizopus arrhizus]|uniref:Uncharacterized protein n=1 Tax=Rhizopus oryzae TaxID=64495 RepID=A0A9P7BJ67_RHIOR|nr:hypothetical protein G6F64_015078 [Rhizopus arrhizus]